MTRKKYIAFLISGGKLKKSNFRGASIVSNGLILHSGEGQGVSSLDREEDLNRYIRFLKM